MPQRAVLLVILATALLRLVLAAPLGLSVDESYTVAISRHLALSYFDHPPLHVWLVRLWARLLGSEQPLLLRLPDLVMFGVSTWLMYRLTAHCYGERAGLWAALALNLAPLFTLNAAAGIVPDGPLVLFSLLMVLSLLRALAVAPGPHAGRGRCTWMAAAGAAAGLALLSKYTALFPVLTLAVYLPVCRRDWLGEPGAWLATATTAVLAALLFMPVLIWNGEHEWASFAFQGARALPSSPSVWRAVAALAGQLLYLLPWLGAALLWALLGALRRGPEDACAWLFACLAAPAVATFTLVALWAPVLPHWAAIGWLFAFPLLGMQLAALEQRRPRLLRALAGVTAVLVLGFAVLVASQVASGWIERRAPAFAARDPTSDFLDWHELEAAATQRQLARRGLVIATVSWIDAGKADYALGGALPVLCLASDTRQFRFMQDLRAWRGRTALIVADAARKDWFRLASRHFARVEPAADVVVMRAGRPALTLRTAYGYGLTVD